MILMSVLRVEEMQYTIYFTPAQSNLPSGQFLIWEEKKRKLRLRSKTQKVSLIVTETLAEPYYRTQSGLGCKGTLIII